MVRLLRRLFLLAGTLLLIGSQVYTAWGFDLPHELPVFAEKGGFTGWLLLSSIPNQHTWLMRIQTAIAQSSKVNIGSQAHQWWNYPVISIGILSQGVYTIQPDWGGPTVLVNRVILVKPDGSLVGLRSPFLYHLLMFSSHPVPPSDVLEVRRSGQRIMVWGKGVLGRSVTIGINHGTLGGAPTPGTRILATVPVQNGEYRWSGALRFPVGGRNHPHGGGWTVNAYMHPLRGFPGFGSYGIGISLPST